MSNGGNTVFAPGVNLENFSARLDGIFKPTEDETLIFDISADDKMRLIVNSDTLVDIWKVRHRIQGDKKELKVKAGEHYRIQIDYVQETGYGALNFDIKKKVNPTQQELLAQIGNAETIIFVGGISPSLETVPALNCLRLSATCWPCSTRLARRLYSSTALALQWH